MARDRSEPRASESLGNANSLRELELELELVPLAEPTDRQNR